MSIIDIFELPGLVVTESFSIGWKRALLLLEEESEKAQFYEDTANNRGIQVKAFTDKEPALQWLKT
jgi:hypothetical protein